MNRRSFITLSTAGSAAAAATSAQGATPSERTLRCGPDGTFRILAISDLHYTPKPDTHGLALTERLIDAEKPGLVVVNGDCISGKSCETMEGLRAAIGHVSAAMEKKRVPWAITFGNHDQEHLPKTGADKESVLAMYAAYPHNMNGGYQRGLTGGGNKTVLIWDAAGREPVYCVWLIDSNEYFQDGKNRPYDWIHADQIDWYRRISIDMENRYGAKIPGLMFFHIPLPEFNEMVNKVKIVGARHEPEMPSPVNSGMFAAIAERGDVRGVYCGHDHVNNYVGRWRGIELGYDGSLGHYAYPRLDPDDPANGRVRGGRVFELTASKPARHTTWMRFKDGMKNWEAASPAYIKDNLKT